MQNNTQHSNTCTLEGIRAEKERVRHEILACKKRMKGSSQKLFKPVKSESRIGNIMNSFDNIFSIVEGVFMGYKLITRIKRSFQKR